jgi:RNA polymerase sigma-70 factor (ECF subfamily)
MQRPEPPAGATDAALIARATGGDRDAFGELYSRYEAAIYRFALQMTGSSSTSEDVVQETFVALLRNLGRYDSGRPLAAYLYGIARNVTRRRLQRERRLVSLDHVVQHQSPTQFPEGLERREHLALLRQAILALPPRHREVIVMCDLHKMSYELAGEAIGRPVGTVRSRLHRARLLLAERMQEFRTPAARAPRGIARCAV